ncbi:hypothetical protein [Actinomadura fibrosa]|uniref:Uncharacterized protein n=1 Tax=Actinomadura fibrosa TaxID=111802 RepID=A0ABW2XRR5_9ACTN|nr:hypothetical protein [Actinomadura fibrosa]
MFRRLGRGTVFRLFMSRAAEMPQPGTTRAAAAEGVAGAVGHVHLHGPAATRHLDGLARVLKATGWSASPRYDERASLLRVLAPGLRGVGESVQVKAGVGGVPWFVTSTGDPLAPCHDLATAAERLVQAMAVCAEAAHRLASEDRRRPGESTSSSPLDGSL